MQGGKGWRHMTTTDQVDKTAGILAAGKELKHFDDTATRLVLEMQVAGWRGHMTGTGHAFMYAPDGVTTTSVSRESLRGRAGRNARAAFERWQKAQAKAKDEAKRTNAFGLTAEQIEQDGENYLPTIGGRPAPVALLSELRRSEEYRAFIQSFPTWDEANASSLFMLRNLDEPRKWAAFDTRVRPPVLIARGSECDVDDAWLHLQEDHPGLFGTESITVNDDGGQAMKLYVCGIDDCKQQFESAGGLNLHRSSKHPELLTCPVEGCGRQVKGHGGLGAHMRSHRPSKKVVEGGATVAPPIEDPVDEASAPPVPVGDVLMDHLERLPEGADAEQMVAAIRALIAAPLVNELRRLRDEREGHLEQIAKLEQDNENLEAKLNIMREAMAL